MEDGGDTTAGGGTHYAEEDMACDGTRMMTMTALFPTRIPNRKVCGVVRRLLKPPLHLGLLGLGERRAGQGCKQSLII